MSIGQFLRRAAKRLAGDRGEFDPTLFDDPLASQVDWSPMSSFMPERNPSKIHQVSPWRLEFRPTLVNTLTNYYWLGAGLFLIVMGVTVLITDSYDTETVLLPILGGIGFALGGVIYSQASSKKHVFDKRYKLCWTGSTSPAVDRSMFQRGDAARLSELHAVQLLTKEGDSSIRTPGYRMTQVSHEINLVFKDGTRHHVLSLGRKSPRPEAQLLASFLDVALWDMQDARKTSTNPRPAQSGIVFPP